MSRLGFVAELERKLTRLLAGLEWQDLYSNGQRRASRYSFPVSIALPTVVKLDTEVKIIEDSGIKNFNVTGLSFEAEGESSKFILIDFTMFSR